MKYSYLEELVEAILNSSQDTKSKYINIKCDTNEPDIQLKEEKHIT
jgi:hypothetical protein